MSVGTEISRLAFIPIHGSAGGCMGAFRYIPKDAPFPLLVMGFAVLQCKTEVQLGEQSWCTCVRAWTDITALSRWWEALKKKLGEHLSRWEFCVFWNGGSTCLEIASYYVRNNKLSSLFFPAAVHGVWTRCWRTVHVFAMLKRILVWIWCVKATR